MSDLNLTLNQGRANFRAELQALNEAVCPCCQRRARINKLRIHSTLALMLARLYYAAKHSASGLPTEWIHIEQFRPSKHGSGRDFSITKHWGLAEAKPAGADDDKPSSGLWRLTPRGVAFVLNQIGVPRFAMVMDDALVGVSGENVTMEEAVKRKFSYAELFAHLGGK